MYIAIGDHIKEGDVIIFDIKNYMNYSWGKGSQQNSWWELLWKQKKESHIFSIPKNCITGSNIYELAIRIYMDRIYNGVSKNK